MQRILKGPILGFCAYLAMLTLAHGAVHVVSGPESGFPLADALRSWTAAGSERVVLLGLTAIGAAGFYVLVLSWTGNRVVGFLAAGLWCVHPGLHWAFAQPGALMDVLPACAVPWALECREAAWRARHRGESGYRQEGLGLGAALVGIAGGPSALAVGPLALVQDLLFHRKFGGPGKAAAVFALAAPVGFLWARSFEGALVPTVPLTARVGFPLFVQTSAGLGTLLIAGLAVLAAMSLWLAGRAARSQPRWILSYGALALSWFLAAEGAAELCSQQSGVVLSLAGLMLMPPVLAWRYLTDLYPEIDRPRHRPPAPVLDPGILEPQEAPRSLAPEVQSSPGGVSLPEVRALVDTAVTSAVDALVRAWPRPTASAGGPEAPGTRYAQEWDRYAKNFAKKAAVGKLGEEWTDRELDRTLFTNYCEPYLVPHGTVLEIGQGGGKFTCMMAPKVQRVVCFDVSRSMLVQAQRDLRDSRNVHYLLGDGRGLGCLDTGSVDFAFSYDVFVHLDQEDIYLYLQDLYRVLRPGGRAVLSFANLLDPLGFRQFADEAERHRGGRRKEGRINFLSPEILRTLVDAAGMRVESLHLAANNRDMLAVLDRPPVGS